MEMDQRTLTKIAETHAHVKHILNSLEEGKETFKDHDARIRVLEQQQQFTSGKVAIIIMSLGAGVTLIINFAIAAWNKLQR